jgi:hypothetical protein
MRGSRLPHDPATVAAVRLYYERTTLTHREIAEKTGVAKTSVYYWALSGGWNRPPGAAKRPLLGKNGLPGPRLKGRMLAKRLRELAEGYLDEMEKEFDTATPRNAASSSTSSRRRSSWSSRGSRAGRSRCGPAASPSAGSTSSRRSPSRSPTCSPGSSR